MAGSADFVEEIDCGSFFDQIDDLIDFPADNGCCGLGFGSGDGGGGASNNFPSIWSNPPDVLPGCHPIFSGNNSNSASDLSAELSVPYEDIVQLEWLSNFVEDSFSGAGMTINKHNINNHFQTSSPISVLETTTTTTTTSSSSSSSSSASGNPPPLNPIQRGPHRARSKRPRPSNFNPHITPTLSLTQPPQLSVLSESENFLESHLVKMMPNAAGEEQKKNKVRTLLNQNPQSVRKCMHCEITKTPQWRAGPMGPKSLCNACGVRYKSGRLLPEYRPAASPTFVPSLHSNSHKKVLEMRTKPVEPEAIPERIPSLDF